MNKYSIIKEFLEAENNISSLLNTLIILIVLNLVVEIFKFFITIYFSKREKKNKRQLLIEEKRIKVSETLFRKLDSLSLYDKNQNEELLSDLKEINLYISQNKLYLSKKLENHSTKILDYFKNVLTDYRQKSIEKESQLLQKYCDEFNK